MYGCSELQTVKISNEEKEKIPEDSFYINLLLGLPQTLRSLGIKDYSLTRCPPLVEAEVMQWERKHGVALPDDMRDFYCSTNGLFYEWYYKFGQNESDNASSSADDEDNEERMKPIVGKIEINALDNLRQVYGYVTGSEHGVTKRKDHKYDIKLSLESKVFEICPILGGKVVLVYLSPRHEPSVWLLTWAMEFSFLAKDFRTYIRMCIAHIGIPNWQFVFTPHGVSEWTKTLFRLLVSHLLPEVNKPLNMQDVVETEPMLSITNKVDPSVFKARLHRSETNMKVEKTETPPKEVIVKKESKASLKGRGGHYKSRRKPLYYVKKR